MPVLQQLILRMTTDSQEKYAVWFFAGGETRNDKFNIFTGSFIKLMQQILKDDFHFIKGIYFRTPVMNVIWALNNGQFPLSDPGESRIIRAAYEQIVSSYTFDYQIIIVSSSFGSIVAAQTACFLAENNIFRNKPIHIVLGSSMISSESELFKRLVLYQATGKIGIIIHDEIQDEGDTVVGMCGKTRGEAYRNALGLVFPLISGKYKNPSFLNTHPERGHVHRKRSKSIQKALDYIDIILVRNMLAGDHYRARAIELLE